jgi:geranylgeranyl diphosphate synthase, type II
MNEWTERYRGLRAQIDTRLAQVIDRTEPETMYTPARYVLEGGGKRIRPVLVMLACEAVGGRAGDALDAGVAVEILHNFTLVHDDIMDNADQRRGRQTVHTKWDANIAILVGDELIGIAYKCLLRTMHGDLRDIISVFTDGMIEVCEGQSYDKEFESREAVSEDEYLMMIAKKTGRLVSMSAELGAIIGGASDVQRRALISYAEHIGRAFQIQDDLLDVVADEKEFGKSIGGDILEGKKTYLLVRALSHAQGEDLDLLMQVVRREVRDAAIVPRVRDIYARIGVLDEARDQIRIHTDDAIHALDALPAGDSRDMLVWFAEMLLARNS